MDDSAEEVARPAPVSKGSCQRLKFLTQRAAGEFDCMMTAGNPEADSGGAEERTRYLEARRQLVEHLRSCPRCRRKRGLAPPPEHGTK